MQLIFSIYVGIFSAVFTLTKKWQCSKWLWTSNALKQVHDSPTRVHSFSSSFRGPNGVSVTWWYKHYDAVKFSIPTDSCRTLPAESRPQSVSHWPAAIASSLSLFPPASDQSPRGPGTASQDLPVQSVVLRPIRRNSKPEVSKIQT